MDTKPWKMHNFSKQRDENAVLEAPLKLIHQRNKSTPALTSILSQKVATTNPIRRAAFADISNKSRQINIQDNGKIKIAADSKPLVQPLGDAKPKGALRPVQRTLSAMNQKALPAEPMNSAVSAASTHVSIPVSDNSSGALGRKTLIKRHTTIFRETTSNTQSRSEIIAELKSSAGISDTVGPTVQETQINNDQANIFAAPQVRLELQNTVEPVEIEPALIPLPQDLDTQSLLDPAFNAYDPILNSLAPQPSQHHQLLEPELYLPALENQLTESLLQQPQPQITAKQARQSDATFLNQSQEPEEYWEEEEEEFFDAEGGVTARSLRSIGGDNTTGGLSVVMNPRINARIERELAAARAWVEENTSPDELDDEAWDTTMVAEYGDEIFSYMRQLELNMMPNAYYMDNQAEIQWSMRSVLIDWVAQVHQRFGLLPETLFLAVNCIDRFLSVKVVSLAKLQLVGATALYIAAKYEEINCPSVQEIAYMVDGSYTVEEILKAERFMLTMLKFEMGWPGPMSFLRRISKADDYEVETRTLAKYFLEVCLMDERFVATLPSFLSAGCHCLARMMLQKGNWSLAHVHYSQYTYSQLRPLILVMLECCDQPRRHHAAIYDKYSTRQYKRASLFVETELQKGFDLPPLPRESLGTVPTSWRRKAQDLRDRNNGPFLSNQPLSSF